MPNVLKNSCEGAKVKSPLLAQLSNDFDKSLKKFTPILKHSVGSMSRSELSTDFKRSQEVSYQTPEVNNKYKRENTLVPQMLTTLHNLDSFSNGNSTIKEHESENLHESDTFSRKSQELINLESCNDFTKLKAAAKLSINDAHSDFKHLLNDTHREEDDESSSMSEHKSITSNSSTSSKVSAHPDFKIRASDKSKIQNQEAKDIMSGSKEVKKYSKCADNIVKFSRNLINFQSNGKMANLNLGQCNRKFSRIHRMKSINIGDCNNQVPFQDSLNQNRKLFKLRRMSTLQNIEMPSCSILKNFLGNDQNSSRISIQQIQEDINRTQQKMNSIILCSPTLNRNENVDLDQISTKLRDSFKLKIQEVMSSQRNLDPSEDKDKINTSKDVTSSQPKNIKQMNDSAGYSKISSEEAKNLSILAAQSKSKFHNSKNL